MRDGAVGRAQSQSRTSLYSPGDATRRCDKWQRTAIVLGAGMVGVSVALHLRQRGWDVVLVDRKGPGEGASFGNSGLIQREAGHPHPFPRALAELQRIARNRAVDVAYHPLALPHFAAPLLRYWWHSAPERYVRAVIGHSRLIATCLDEHMALAREAEATDLLRPIGWLQLYGTLAGFGRAMSMAETANRESASITSRSTVQLSPGRSHTCLLKGQARSTGRILTRSAIRTRSTLPDARLSTRAGWHDRDRRCERPTEECFRLAARITDRIHRQSKRWWRSAPRRRR